MTRTIEFPSPIGAWWSTDGRPIGEVQEAPGADRPYRLVAALGPRMLELSREAADGTFPYLGTPEHTAAAREAIGPGRTLIVEQGAVLTDDRETWLRRAHDYLSYYTGLPNYRNNWLRLGFAEADLCPVGRSASRRRWWCGATGPRSSRGCA